MKVLPKDVSVYRKTREFSESTVPDAVLNGHRTKEGVWGKIIVLKGSLDYLILEPEMEIVHLSQNEYGVVEPTILHRVKPVGSTRFYVEFLR